MKINNWDSNYSNDYLFYEILVRIFTILNVVDLTVASMVCKSWNLASRAPQIWNKLDLTTLSSKSLHVPLTPQAWIDEHSSKNITQFLKYASSLSGENITCIIFNYRIYLTDVSLISIAERTPNLKRLVLPMSGNISKDGIETAMKLWGGLESITTTKIIHDFNIFDAIGKYCKNIVSLKLTCCFGKKEAEGLIKYTPNLKVLSVRNIMIHLRSLYRVLKTLKHLEVLNVSHSVIFDKVDGRFQSFVIGNEPNRGDILCKIINCERRSCFRCKNRYIIWDPTRLPIPYAEKALEDIWHEDEIMSLAH